MITTYSFFEQGSYPGKNWENLGNWKTQGMKKKLARIFVSQSQESFGHTCKRYQSKKAFFSSRRMATNFEIIFEKSSLIFARKILKECKKAFQRVHNHFFQLSCTLVMIL